MEARKASDIFFHGDNEFFLLDKVTRATRAGEELVVWFNEAPVTLSDDAEIERFTKAFAEMLESEVSTAKTLVLG